VSLHIQRFLRETYGSADQQADFLLKKFAIKATRHQQHPNLYLFKYNQFDSPFHEPVVQEARGIILDSADNWNVVAMPYTKFFNHGEPLAAEIDWNTAEVYEKLDGSLITMYFYADQWHVSTSGVPDATCKTAFDLTFGELFWQTFASEGMDKDDFSPEHCYMFELCAPQNRVVVKHAEPRIYLHGIRNVKSLREEDPHQYSWLARMAPFLLGLRSLSDCLLTVKALDPLASEGYVVRDKQFRRLKIKSPAYLALHHAKDGLMSRKAIALLIRDGEEKEFATALESFPELKDDFDALVTRYRHLVEGAEYHLKTYNDIEDQKQFALAVRGIENNGALFALRSGKARSVQQYLKECITAPSYLRLMGVRD
jgi:hypothetical protein